MEAKDKSSILISIFRRKGSEGQFTKIIDENSKSQYDNLLSSLDHDEKGLIVYYRDSVDWLLLTNRRVLASSNIIILNSDIIEVSPALQEEFRDMVTNKNKFTRLLVKDKNNKTYILSLEMGYPYEGFFQVLHFIASNNQHT
ncbi:hypothetical protein SAMN05660461_5042 [Chitinophaga ginsengisegetis]|uniref:Uncharacterized protein n=1 Tax=Chitinophaga ginsengisegetis TaxID=393003 RepID=A0A1T5P8V9_9BACT|nr:hypothetical protein [Chitinophaga ginsengisegetis]SKD09161.1 hypothetical protein SAMN05660461_5042 [Chitinophaga ginsengisegetis]